MAIIKCTCTSSTLCDMHDPACTRESQTQAWVPTSLLDVTTEGYVMEFKSPDPRNATRMTMLVPRTQITPHALKSQINQGKVRDQRTVRYPIN